MKSPKLFRFLSLLVGVLPGPAFAQLNFAGDEPHIYTIEPREHLFKHELHLGAGLIPLDAFYVGAVGAVGYTYHLSDFWAWEAFQGIYSYNVDTSLRSDLQQLGAQASLESARRIHLMLSTNLVAKPMYGKVSLVNRSLVQIDTAIMGGAGFVLNDQDMRPALNLGVALHFWMSSGLGVRFDVRDYFVFNHAIPDNVLLILLSWSVNFSFQTTNPKTPLSRG